MDKGVKTFCVSKDEVNIDTDLALRFLRVRRDVDSETKELLLSCVDEFKSVVSYKACYRCFDVKIENNIVCFDDDIALESDKLAKNLKGCDRAFMFVATTSVGVDRLIKKHMALRVSRALVIDAIGSAAVEGFCDLLCETLKREYSVSFRPRFSPGYGDLSIKCQSSVLGICDASRKIGVTLTDKYMMIPKKTVSAIVGVRPKGEVCDKASSCEICDNINCLYRE